MTKEYVEFSTTYETFAILATICSASVVLTYFWFPQLRNKLHMKLVTSISFCDMMSNFAASWGEPSRGTALCAAQGVIGVYFHTTALFWTTCVSYMLYMLVQQGSITVTFEQLSCVCWLVPLVAVLLPYISASYDREAGSDAAGWCYLSLNEGTPAWQLTFWAFVNFYMWLLLALLLMGFWSGSIYYRFTYQRSSLASVILRAVEKLQLYPIVMALSWAPIAVVRMLDFSSSFDPNASWVAFVSFIPALLQGICVAIVFFYTNEYVRKLWRGQWQQWMRELHARWNPKSLEVSTAASDKITITTAASITDSDRSTSATISGSFTGRASDPLNIPQAAPAPAPAAADRRPYSSRSAWGSVTGLLRTASQGLYTSNGSPLPTPSSSVKSSSVGSSAVNSEIEMQDAGSGGSQGVASSSSAGIDPAAGAGGRSSTASMYDVDADDDLVDMGTGMGEADGLRGSIAWVIHSMRGSHGGDRMEDPVSARSTMHDRPGQQENPILREQVQRQRSARLQKDNSQYV